MCQFSVGEQRHGGGDNRRAADGHRDILDNPSVWCAWSAVLCADGDTAEFNPKVTKTKQKHCTEDDSCPSSKRHVANMLGFGKHFCSRWQHLWLWRFGEMGFVCLFACLTHWKLPSVIFKECSTCKLSALQACVCVCVFFFVPNSMHCA